MTSRTQSEWYRFADTVALALETAAKENPQTGCCGIELELNLLDGSFKPLERVGAGPESRSFADYFRDERLPGWARDRFQLEVFHWMTEMATRPYFKPRGAASEARLLEAVILNALAEAELAFDRPLLALHGNLPVPVTATEESIPDGWNLAHKRYLARCVRLFGDKLATAGVHTNHSFPEPLLSWDFIHLPRSEREGRTLEDFRNDVVIRATRLLRPYCALFLAISACSPLASEVVEGEPRIVLTGVDSQRMLTFPNPEDLDIPGLYSNHREYLRRSYGLVRSGVRFGANNWTPVRARSGVEPVMRNILATADQLRELYSRGLYAGAEAASLEEMERAITVEKLCARVDLPMNRVEVRTDEGGDSLDLSIAKVAFKQLLMLRFYREPRLGAEFAYNDADVARARRNETAAAERGLDAMIENPFTGERVGLREWLAVTLAEVAPLAEALEWRADLEPLREMAGGGPNPAGSLRAWLSSRLDGGPRSPAGNLVVPAELLAEWVRERTARVAEEAERIARSARGGREGWKLKPLLEGLLRQGQDQPSAPVRLGADRGSIVTGVSGGRTAEVVELAGALIRIPSVTNCPDERLDEVARCGRFVAGWLRAAGLEVRLYDDARYPSVVASFPGAEPAAITLAGHFDVVRPEPDDRQFEPRVDGDFLWGRGSADMKTVVASFMIWMRDQVRAGSRPQINLLLVGNEENGESEPNGTPHVLADLQRTEGWAPELMIVGERTGEAGDERLGRVCTANRGILRMKVIARGRRGHTGTGRGPRDLLDRLIEAREGFAGILERRLTLSSLDGWESGARFPFLNVGEEGIYNITAGSGVLGVEVRPIPEDDPEALVRDAHRLCRELHLDLEVEVMEPGVACPPDNPHLGRLLDAVEAATGAPARTGRKLPGSSARFAPGGNAVVWGQSGVGPHSAEERHFIPSIEPYLAILDALAERVTPRPGSSAAGAGRRGGPGRRP